jgi:hypothetical protein
MDHGLQGLNGFPWIFFSYVIVLVISRLRQAGGDEKSLIFVSFKIPPPRSKMRPLAYESGPRNDPRNKLVKNSARILVIGVIRVPF